MNHSTKFQNMAVGVLALCALVVTGLVVKREVGGPSPSVLPRPHLTRSIGLDVDLARNLALGGHLLGRSDAPVRIVEFADLKCAFCARAAPALDSILRARGDRVAVVFRHRPLQSAPSHNYQAAMASECAADQGRFAAFIRTAYARQDSIGQIPWTVLASHAGVPDTTEFGTCLRAARFADRIQEDIEAAARAGVVGTPTFVIGGKLFVGFTSDSALAAEIDRAIGS